MIDRAQKTLLSVVALSLFVAVAALSLFSERRGARVAYPAAGVRVEVATGETVVLAHPLSGDPAAFAAEEGRRPIPDETTVTASEPSTVVLRGFLRERVLPDADLRVSVSGVWGVKSKTGRIEQRFPSSASGSFELDVTALFASGRPDVLAVSAKSGQRVGWSSVAVGDAGSTHAGPRVLTTTLDLDLPCELAGEVHPPAGARVAAFHTVGGVPLRMAADHVDVSHDGSFRLRLPVASSYLIVAYAEGLRPTSRAWNLGFERSDLLPTFDLDLGAIIAGRVRLGGRALGATVAAVPEQRDARGFVAGRDELVLMNGCLEWGAVAARARSDGDFVLGGLAPGVYRVSVSGIALENGATVGRLPTATATAPAVGLDLSPEAAHVRLEFHGDLAMLAKTGYALEQDFGSAGVTVLTVRPNADGLAELWLSPGDPVRGLGTSFEFLPRDCATGPPCVVDVSRGE